MSGTQKCLVAAAIAFVCAVAPAYGSPAADVRLSLQIAETHWGGPPTCGAPLAQGVIDFPEDLGGHAYRDECRFEYNLDLLGEGYGFADLCNVVVHEVGHLHGLDHTADDTIMGYGTVPACDQEGRRRGRVEKLSRAVAEQRYSCAALRRAGRRVASCHSAVRRLRGRLVSLRALAL